MDTLTINISHMIKSFKVENNATLNEICFHLLQAISSDIGRPVGSYYRPCLRMLCYVMSCHVMSCHVMSCHVMSCHVHVHVHVMLCYVMLCYVTLRCSISFQQNIT